MDKSLKEVFTQTSNAWILLIETILREKSNIFKTKMLLKLRNYVSEKELSVISELFDKEFSDILKNNEEPTIRSIVNANANTNANAMGKRTSTKVEPCKTIESKNTKTNANKNKKHIIHSENELTSMTNNELKTILMTFNRPKTGPKKVLVKRILEAYEDISSDSDSEDKNQDDIMISMSTDEEDKSQSTMDEY